MRGSRSCHDHLGRVHCRDLSIVRARRGRSCVRVQNFGRLRRTGQRGNDGAIIVGPDSFAASNQDVQRACHGFQLRHALLNFCQPPLRDFAHAPQVSFAAQRGQFSDIIQRESERLSPLDELQALDIRSRVFAKASGAPGFRQKAAPLVVAHRLHADACRVGEFGYREGVSRHGELSCLVRSLARCVSKRNGTPGVCYDCRTGISFRSSRNDDMDAHAHHDHTGCGDGHHPASASAPADPNDPVRGMMVPPPIPAGSAPAATIYTCPMHPQIRASKPGNCPICGMALEPVMPTLDEGPNAEYVNFAHRFWWTLPLTVTVTGLAMLGHRWHLLDAAIQPWVELGLAAPVVWW